MTQIARLDSRALIRVSGPDARPFLHNLLTQDVETLAEGAVRYGALLSPPGRLLFDLFLWGTENGVVLDVAADRREALIEDYKAHFANPYSAAERGYIDDVIEPRETRPKLIQALRTLKTKRVPQPKRKHGNIPL